MCVNGYVDIEECTSFCWVLFLKMHVYSHYRLSKQLPYDGVVLWIRVFFTLFLSSPLIYLIHLWYNNYIHNYHLPLSLWYYYYRHYFIVIIIIITIIFIINSLLYHMMQSPWMTNKFVSSNAVRGLKCTYRSFLGSIELWSVRFWQFVLVHVPLIGQPHLFPLPNLLEDCSWKEKRSKGQKGGTNP